MKQRRQRNFNLANWLVGLGFVALATTFALPWVTAPRTARIEGRADQVAGYLLQAATTLDFEDWKATWAGAVLHARTAALLARDDVPLDAFVRDGDPIGGAAYGDGRVFRGKHYEYLLVPGAASGAARKGETAPLEVYAYPAELLSTAQTAFFHGELEEVAFTRNLQANYKGEPALRRPDAGAGVPREARKVGDESYRGRDDERWLVPSQTRR